MTYQWTTKDLDDLEQFYWTEIAPAMEADGRDPERDQPPYTWLCGHGLGGFIKALRRDHDLTPTEFYDRLGIGPEEEPGYWAIDHEPTRTVLESYIEELRSRRGHPETTVRPIRSRLKKYAQLYADVNETANLLDPLREQTVRPAEIDRALAVFDVLETRLETLSDRSDWDGYLFPSPTAASGHIVTDTVRNRFGMLAERAGVTVKGEIPTPKMGRRFWYTLYGDAVRQLAERYEPIADDQGSADPGVVLDNYLSESERRSHRRSAMQQALTTVLGEPA